MVDVGGVFLAVLSAVLNGTFGTLSKIKRVQHAEVQFSIIPQINMTLRSSNFSVAQEN